MTIVTVTNREALLNSGVILLLAATVLFFMGVYMSGSLSLFMAMRSGMAILLFLAAVCAIFGVYCWIKAFIVKDD